MLKYEKLTNFLSLLIKMQIDRIKVSNYKQNNETANLF
jgi:hypothetical protein